MDYRDGDKWKLTEPDLVRLKQLFMEWQEGMERENGWNAVFWCNHDQPRAISRFGDDGRYWKESAKMLATVIHMFRGTPYVYQGKSWDDQPALRGYFPVPGCWKALTITVS